MPRSASHEQPRPHPTHSTPTRTHTCHKQSYGECKSNELMAPLSVDDTQHKMRCESNKGCHKISAVYRYGRCAPTATGSKHIAVFQIVQISSEMLATRAPLYLRAVTADATSFIRIEWNINKINVIET